MKSLALFALLLLSGPAFAGNEPVTFSLQVTTGLAKLTPSDDIPGTVESEPAEGSGTETVTLTLDNCGDENIDGRPRCSKLWSKVLKMDGRQTSYFVNVYNKTGSDEYNVVLMLCQSGEPEAGNCSQWISGQLDFAGKLPSRLSYYDSGRWNGSVEYPAAYQSMLVIEPVK